MLLLFMSTALLCMLGVIFGASFLSPSILSFGCGQLAFTCNWNLVAFILVAAWRYVRPMVHAIASWTFQPFIPGQWPVFTSQDCTVVMATLDGSSPVFARCVDSIVENSPFKLLIVTPYKNKARLEAQFEGNDMVTVLGAKRANKRFQQVCGLTCVTTAITAFVDDDVIWPKTFLWTTLGTFDDPTVGACGTSQRCLRDQPPSVWEFLGALYLQRRNFECSATANINGYISTLSGRTQILRTSIINTREFSRSYLTELWLGKIPMLNADDDKFITRWVRKQGWKLAFQYCVEAELETTLENSWLFLQQCVRWYRTIWRGVIISVLVERSAFRGQPWAVYANLSRAFNPPAIIMDGILARLLHNAVQPHRPDRVTLAMVLFTLWVLLSKTMKFIPYFWRHPTDLKYLPLQWAFAYLHGAIKLYALATCTSTSWLGRTTVEDFESYDVEDVCPVGGIPANIATPGVTRVIDDGTLEHPLRKKRPGLARRTTSGMLVVGHKPS